jgi:hypothetical protein
MIALMTIVGYVVQPRVCLDGRPTLHLVWEVWSPRRFSRVLVATRDGERAEFARECFEARRARLVVGQPVGALLSGEGRA